MADERLNNGLHSLDTLHKMFDVVMACVADSGGDGWGFIITVNPLILADEFQRYAEHHAYGHILSRSPDGLMFSDGQEGITFAAIPFATQYRWYEIVVTIP